MRRFISAHFLYGVNDGSNGDFLPYCFYWGSPFCLMPF